MIRHVILFRFRPGVNWDDPRALAAERLAEGVGTHVPDVLTWWTRRNISTREIAYDFMVEGTFADLAAVERYLVDPYHVDAVERWRAISEWVMVDVEDDGPARGT